MAIFDHPRNVRHPTPWYASTRAGTYGEGWANFLNAAFLWNDALAWPAHTPLELLHRVLVHDGSWTTEHIDDAYHRFVAG